MSHPKRRKPNEAVNPMHASRPQTHAAGGFDARTTYPTAGQEPVQLKIKWGTEDKSLAEYGSTEDKDSLAAALHEKHPHISLAAIYTRLTEIEAHTSWFSMSDIRIHFNQYARQVPVPLGKAEQGSGVSLPSRRAERLDYGFTTRTRLRATIDGEAVGEATNDDDHHAEENIIPLIEDYITSNRINPKKSSLIITINNSPCLDRCAPQLAKAQARWGFREFRINYANPYGDQEEFRESASRMGATGIALNPFDPRAFLARGDKLSADQTERMESMARRRNAISLPDPASSSGRSKGFTAPSASSSSASTRARSRSRGRSSTKKETARDRSASPDSGRSGDKRAKKSSSSILHDPEAYRNLIEDGDVDTIGGQRVRVVHADDNGSCFYESLAYHLGDEFNARDLRRQAYETLEAQGDHEAALRARSRGGYAQRAEMTALAEHVGATFVIYQYLNSWDEDPVTIEVGDGDTTYYFIQTLAHIRPLDIL